MTAKVVNWDVKNKNKQIFINENSIILDYVNLQGSSIMKTCLQCVVLFTLLCMSCQLSDVVVKQRQKVLAEAMLKAWPVMYILASPHSGFSCCPF